MNARPTDSTSLDSIIEIVFGVPSDFTYNFGESLNARYNVNRQPSTSNQADLL
jgi:hypothetical protein